MLPTGVGVVRIYHVLVSANSRTETVEDLEGSRKRVVVQVLDTIHADVCSAVDAAVKTEEFKERLAQDKYGTREVTFKGTIVLCSYFAQRSGERNASRSGARNVEEALQGLDSFRTSDMSHFSQAALCCFRGS